MEDNKEHLGPISAEIEAGDMAAEARGTDVVLEALERRIRDLEASIGDLRSVSANAVAAAQAAAAQSALAPASAPGRKTSAPASFSLLAKQGTEPAADGASLDDALRSLSIEQRIAVKSGMVRAGLLR